jgi:hypothetical protein
VSADKPRRMVELWGGIIAHEEEDPDSEQAIFIRAIDVSTDAFGRHKAALLNHLQQVYESGPKSKRFDAEKSWRPLDRIAWMYFWHEGERQRTTPAADRVRRLRELAKALGRARRLVEKATQDDVGNDLFSAWCDANVRYDIDPTPPLTLVRIDDEFEKVIASLPALEIAALRAADEIPKKDGRPRGTALLRWDFIEVLAKIYRNSTGSKPGAGDGPFARFVYEFITALGRRNVEYSSIVDAIKDTRSQVRMRSSPFDDET